MAREILPGVTEVTFPRALVNAYVVQADVPTLIDTGTPGGAGKLLSAARRAGGDIERIILTHRHADHAGNAAELARTTRAEVLVAPMDAEYVTEAREQPRPRAATPIGHGLVAYVKVALPWTLDPVPDARPVLVDGESVGPFTVIATPGHTAGHVSLLWAERGLLFAGDAAANLTAVGPHPAADERTRARDSFAALARRDFDAVVFGHGRALTRNGADRFLAAR
jgi:glyoxylase-like metal-dependent hydrolase (beta-lactamase superfamily II)